MVANKNQKDNYSFGGKVHDAEGVRFPCLVLGRQNAAVVEIKRGKRVGLLQKGDHNQHEYSAF